MRFGVLVAFLMDRNRVWQIIEFSEWTQTSIFLFDSIFTCLPVGAVFSVPLLKSPVIPECETAGLSETSVTSE
jgi:hypothetical protein